MQGQMWFCWWEKSIQAAAPESNPNSQSASSCSFFSCSRNLFIRPIIPLKELLNKFFSGPLLLTLPSVDYTLICYFCRTGCFAKSCAHKLAANCAQLLRFNIKCCIRFWIRFCIAHRGSDCPSGGKVLGCCVGRCSHAQTRAPGKSRSKIDRTESHHQDWRDGDEEGGNNIYPLHPPALECLAMVWGKCQQSIQGPVYSGLYIYRLYSLYTACIPASICPACRQPI